MQSFSTPMKVSASATTVGMRFQLFVSMLCALFLRPLPISSFSIRRRYAEHHNDVRISTKHNARVRGVSQSPFGVSLYARDSQSSVDNTGSSTSSRSDLASITEDDALELKNDDDGKLRQQTLVWKRLTEWFQGDFDNYAQVVSDRKQNMEPREGGGHEHFHCTLVPVTESTRLAAFFFDGNPDRIFRFRYYELTPSATNNEGVEMMLNTLHPDLEKLLKSHATSPMEWPQIFHNFQPSNAGEPKVSILEKCEICWSFEKDPVQHSYLPDTSEAEDSSDSLHAIMINGPTIVNSTIIPGMQIRIIDQLSLYQDVFYINDRGFDPITGGFIYGNQREVPYRLERVSSISTFSSIDTEATAPLAPENNDFHRVVVNPKLEWTIGPDFRTKDEYELKILAIGGPSAGMNRNK